MSIQKLTIQCDRVLRLYRIGDIVNFRFSGTQGSKCQVSISGDATGAIRRNGSLPMSIRVPLLRKGKVCCEVTSDGETVFSMIFAAPSELLNGSETEIRSRGYQRYGNHVNEFDVSRFRAIAKERSERIVKINTKAQAEMPFGILKITDLPETRQQIHAEILQLPNIGIVCY